jgi:hypothetical protein
LTTAPSLATIWGRLKFAEKYRNLEFRKKERGEKNEERFTANLG